MVGAQGRHASREGKNAGTCSPPGRSILPLSPRRLISVAVCRYPITPDIGVYPQATYLAPRLLTGELLTRYIEIIACLPADLSSPGGFCKMHRYIRVVRPSRSAGARSGMRSPGPAGGFMAENARDGHHPALVAGVAVDDPTTGAGPERRESRSPVGAGQGPPARAVGRSRLSWKSSRRGHSSSRLSGADGGSSGGRERGNPARCTR